MKPFRLAVVLLLLPASVMAQPDDGAGGETVHDKAVGHYERGEYAEAAEAFKAAYLAEPKPELLYAIGQALRQAGRCNEALEYYRQYLRTQPGPKQVVSTRENMKRCEAPPGPATRPQSLPTAVLAKPVVRAAPRQPKQPRHRAWYRDWLGGALLGAGLGATGAGAAVFAVGRGRVEEANNAADYGSFDRLYGSGQTGELQQKVGIAMLATGAALVTASIVRYLLLRRSAARAER